MNAVSGIGSRVMTRPMSNRSRITPTPRDPSRLSYSPNRLVVTPISVASDGTSQMPVGRQSLLWRNLRTNTTTNRMAIAANTNPPR